MKIFILLSLLATLALAQPGLCPEERVPYAVPEDLFWDLTFTELSVTDWDIPSSVATFVLPDSDYLYVSCGRWGLMIWNISDPTDPYMVSHADGDGGEDSTIYGTLREFDLYQDTLLVGVTPIHTYSWSGIVIVNVADETNPEVVSFCELRGHPNRAFAEDGYAYTVWHENSGASILGPNGLVIFDIHDPEHPFIVDTIETTIGDFSIGLWYSDGYAYVVEAQASTASFYIIDVRDPYDAEIVYWQTYSGCRSAVAVGDYLWVLGIHDFTVYDITDRTAPVEIMTDDFYPHYCTTLDYPYIYCSTGAGVVVLDISVPASSYIAGFQAVEACYNAAASDSILYASGWYDLYIYKMTDTGIEEEPTKPDDYSISAYPNPFNSAVTNFFDCQSRNIGNPEIEIFDINGRMVERIPPRRVQVPAPLIKPKGGGII